MQLNKENTRIETKGLVMVAMKQEKIGTRNGASTVHDVMSLAMDLTDVRSSVPVSYTHLTLPTNSRV